jgi:cytosine/adenosine deaminase-related metal-dependent hydrolase
VSEIRLWCEHAWLGGWSATEGVLLTLSDGRFTDVTSGVDAAPEDAITLAGLTLPGFVNGFATLSDRALRGFGHDRAALREASIDLSARLDMERWTNLAEAVLAEMSLAGFTTVGAVVPMIDGLEPLRVLRATIDAAERVGVRLTGLVAAPVGTTQTDGLDRWMSSLDSTYEHLNSHDLCRGGVLVSDPAISDAASLKAITRWISRYGGPLVARISADQDSHLACKAAHDATAVELFDRINALSNRGGFIGIHGVALTESDAAALGRTRASVCVTATGDRDLGTGVPSLDALRASGVRLMIGTGLGAVIDPLSELRAMEGHARLATGRRPFLTPPELLRTATSDATVALGWRDTGLIASGQRADLVTISLTKPATAGASPDNLLSHIVSSATSSDITHVVVGGELVAQGGRHRRGDVGEMLASALGALR